jgi:hypothetical protein
MTAQLARGIHQGRQKATTRKSFPPALALRALSSCNAQTQALRRP